MLIRSRARHSISDIFNSSITEDVVPGLQKLTIKVSIPKTNPPDSLDDPRPTSLTPIPCKILERIIAKELWKAFILRLDHRQFGNIKCSSSVHYLVDLNNYITSNLDKRLEVTAVPIDLRKVFDIDHTTLIKNMISLGFHEGWEKWGSQRTRANNKTSDETDLHCGAPQGTVLALIYKHVDDMKHNHKREQSNISLQDALNQVSEWASSNKMSVNTKKCTET
nr:uncharacterized protein LOC113826215 [Penaeus vannamei]